MCFLYEKRVEPSGTESTAWFCIRRYGGSICVVAADTIHRHVRGNGKICIFTGSNRIYIWNPVFTADGQMNEDKPEGLPSHLKKTTMLVLAVTLHNIPEGMAVGVVFAGLLSGNNGITLAGAFSLSIGIAIQNFPEGAIISLPLKSEGGSTKKAFWYGVASGVVEPIAAGITIILAGIITHMLPYLLAFAAGAMIYVVVEELLPEASEGEHSNINTIGFAAGFLIMMILDVALG